MTHKMLMDKIAGSKNDEFYTPDYAVFPIIQYLKPNAKIWCTFDTPNSAFVRILQDAGFIVNCTHISTGGDFFELMADKKYQGYDYIISNPPYSLKTKVLERLFNCGVPFAMLLGVAGLFEGRVRFTMFKENKFEIMYFDRRIDYLSPDGQTIGNTPFSSVYVCKDILPQQIVFETIHKQ